MNKTMNDIRNAAILATPGIMSLLPVGAVKAEGNHVDLTNITMSGNSLNVPGASSGGNGMADTFNNILGQGHTLISGITGVAAIILVIIFIIKATKLGSSGDNPAERSKAINGLIFLFIAAALLGGTSLFTGMFWNMFAQ
jgi:hypothetical protein